MNQRQIIDIIQQEARRLGKAVIANTPDSGRWISIKIDETGRRKPYSFFIYDDGSTHQLAVNTTGVPVTHPCGGQVKLHYVRASHTRWDLSFPEGTPADQLRPLIRAVLEGVRPYTP